MALLSVQALGSASAITMSAADGGGDTFANDGKAALLVTNADASPITVTIDAPGTCSFGLAANAAHDLAVTVAAGATKLIKVADTARFNDSSNIVSVGYSAVTNVTVAAIRY